MNKEKLLQRVLQGGNNVSFEDFRKLVECFGFNLDRVHGSHFIFKRVDIGALVNIQNVLGKAKRYQIKQFLSIVERHNLKLEDKQQ